MTNKTARAVLMAALMVVLVNDPTASAQVQLPGLEPADDLGRLLEGVEGGACDPNWCSNCVAACNENCVITLIYECNWDQCYCKCTGICT